jgi:hypothetical protein
VFESGCWVCNREGSATKLRGAWKEHWAVHQEADVQGWADFFSFFSPCPHQPDLFSEEIIFQLVLSAVSSLDLTFCFCAVLASYYRFSLTPLSANAMLSR